MAKKVTVLSAIILISAIAVLLTRRQGPALAISGPLVRENQTVVVNGVMEMWQVAMAHASRAVVRRVDEGCSLRLR
jgi:hypothetical protein